MSYRIVVDSCGEFTEEMAKDSHFVHAALNLEIDGNHFVDDETPQSARDQHHER